MVRFFFLKLSSRAPHCSILSSIKAFLVLQIFDLFFVSGNQCGAINSQYTIQKLLDVTINAPALILQALTSSPT